MARQAITEEPSNINGPCAPPSSGTIAASAAVAAAAEISTRRVPFQPVSGSALNMQSVHSRTRTASAEYAAGGTAVSANIKITTTKKPHTDVLPAAIRSQRPRPTA